MVKCRSSCKERALDLIGECDNFSLYRAAHPRSTPTRTSVQAAEPSEDDRPLQELKGAGQRRTLPLVLSTNNMVADRVGDVVEEYTCFVRRQTGPPQLGYIRVNVDKYAATVRVFSATG